ncbi:MAG: hypothetical protein M3536_00300 [Actinomycetota bacterium]|nr:hypothetical protein [Actinomycetota bacterium]
MTAPDPRLGEIEARLAKITPGPWDRPLNTRYKASVTAEMPKGDPTSRWKGNVDHEGNPERVSIVNCPIWSTGKFFRKQSGRDLDFIAHSPADVAYLLAELRKRDDALANVTEVLDGWAAEIPFEDAEESQRWYSLGKRHAAERIRLELADPCAAIAAATGAGE